MRDAWLDLIVGSACVGCGRPGRLLCAGCADALPRGASVAWPTPTPTGLAPPFAAGAYDGLLQTMVNAHKERQCFALAAPLARCLVLAVEAALDAVAGGDDRQERRWLLVPVPSRPAVVRARGHDPMLRVSRLAAATARRRGHRVSVVRLLRSVGPVRDQAGLDAAERGANLAGSMACRRRVAARVPASRGPAGVLVADDVLTTGSTAREAQRALAEAGVPVSAVVTVAATRRRSARRSDVQPGPSRPGTALPNSPGCD